MAKLFDLSLRWTLYLHTIDRTDVVCHHQKCIVVAAGKKGSPPKVQVLYLAHKAADESVNTSRINATTCESQTVELLRGRDNNKWK